MRPRDLPEPKDGTHLLVVDDRGGATYAWRDDHRAERSVERWYRPGQPVAWEQMASTWAELVRNAIAIWGLSEEPLASGPMYGRGRS